MYLPACLINQIGVKGTDSRRHARMKGLLRRDSVNLGFAFTLKLDTFALTSLEELYLGVARSTQERHQQII